MAKEVEVKVRVDTGSATKNLDDLGGSIDKVGQKTKDVAKHSESYSNVLKDQARNNDNLQKAQQQLNEATGGMSEVMIKSAGSVKLVNGSLQGMKAAIIETGIGALVVLVGYLVSALVELINNEEKSEQAVKDLNKALEQQSKQFDEVTDRNKFFNEQANALAKAQGKSRDEILKNNKEFLAAEQERIEKELQLLQIEAQAILDNADLTTEARHEQTEKVIAEMEKLSKQKQSNQREGFKLENDYAIESLELQKQSAEKKRAEQERINEKAKADAKAQQDALNNLEKKYQDDIENLQDKTAQQKLDRQKERAIEELNALKISAKDRQEALLLINEDFRLKQEALDKAQDDRLLALQNQFAKEQQDLLAVTEEDKLTLKIQRDTLALETELATMVGDEEKKQELRTALDEKNQLLVNELAEKRKNEKLVQKETELQETSANEQLEFQARLDALIQRDLLIDQQTNLTDAQRIEAKKKNKDMIDAINKQVVASEKAKEEAKLKIATAGIQALSSLTNLMFGEGKKAQAIQKGLTLAQIGIDTASAFSSLMAGSEAAAVATGPAYPFAKPLFYASGVVQILANVMKAKQALSSSESGGDTGGASASAPSVPSVPQAPINPNVIADSGVNQLASTLTQAPIKAYVVGKEVTTQQSLDRNIVETATLG